MFGVTCGKVIPSRLLLVLAIAGLMSIHGGTSATADELLIVHLDQAKILKVPDRTGTLIVGNPVIADATVQPGGLVVITAKSYGLTNLIALDRAGVKLLEHSIQVVAPIDPIVVVYRGVERESYSCVPFCQRRITIGDSPAYFDANLNQIGEFGKQAQGQPQK
jgi:Flp pilus assembly secretin CpaC